MGAWGYSPLENDATIDWLEQLFDVTSFTAAINATLALEPNESPEEIRSAAHLFSTLNQAGLWPHENIESTRQLAKRQLSSLIENKVYTNPLIVRQIRRELAVLDGRVMRR